MRLITTSLAILCFIAAEAQSIRGKVFAKTESGKEILRGATVLWANTQIAAASNENGVFEILLKGITDFRLVAMHVGYLPDTLNVKGLSYVSFILNVDTAALSGVTVKGNTDPVKKEIINERELTKAACCDLAGCFET